MLCDYFCCIAMIYLEISRLLAQERGEMGEFLTKFAQFQHFADRVQAEQRTSARGKHIQPRVTPNNWLWTRLIGVGRRHDRT